MGRDDGAQKKDRRVIPGALWMRGCGGPKGMSFVDIGEGEEDLVLTLSEIHSKFLPWMQYKTLGDRLVSNGRTVKIEAVDSLQALREAGIGNGPKQALLGLRVVHLIGSMRAAGHTFDGWYACVWRSGVYLGPKLVTMRVVGWRGGSWFVVNELGHRAVGTPLMDTDRGGTPLYLSLIHI